MIQYRDCGTPTMRTDFMRLGVFGGTFDPIHLGHLLLAECCREQGRLDRVLFVPTAVPPHKQHGSQIPVENRIEMIELAIGGNEAFSVNRHEADLGGVNYTVDTLEHFRGEFPDNELFLLLGADMLHDLPHWRDSARVCQLAVPMVVCRPGEGMLDFDCLATVASPERIDLIRRHRVDMPEMGISSTEIRRRVAAGHSIRYQTPAAVEQYLKTHGLYSG